MKLRDKIFLAASGVCITGMSMHIAKGINRNIFPPITHHIGDFGLVSIPILFSAHLADAVRIISQGCNSKLLEKIADYTPEIIASATALYFTLGESLYNIIPGNTKDLSDIPAVLIATASSYLIAKTIDKEFKSIS